MKTYLRSRLLVDPIPDEVKQEASTMPSDGIIYHAAVPENHQFVLQMHGMATF